MVYGMPTRAIHGSSGRAKERLSLVPGAVPALRVAHFSSDSGACAGVACSSASSGQNWSTTFVGAKGIIGDEVEGGRGLGGTLRGAASRGAVGARTRAGAGTGGDGALEERGGANALKLSRSMGGSSVSVGVRRLRFARGAGAWAFGVVPGAAPLLPSDGRPGLRPGSLHLSPRVARRDVASAEPVTSLP